MILKFYINPRTCVSNQLAYRLEDLKTLSLGSIDLLEWLTELEEVFYLIDCQFIIKGYVTQELPGGNNAQVKGKGYRASILSPSVHLPLNALNPFF